MPIAKVILSSPAEVCGSLSLCWWFALCGLIGVVAIWPEEDLHSFEGGRFCLGVWDMDAGRWTRDGQGLISVLGSDDGREGIRTGHGVQHTVLTKEGKMTRCMQEPVLNVAVTCMV